MKRDFLLPLALTLGFCLPCFARGASSLEEVVRNELVLPRDQSELVKIDSALWSDLIEHKIISWHEGKISILKGDKYFSPVRSFPSYEVLGVKVLVCRIDLQTPLPQIKEGENRIAVGFKTLWSNPFLSQSPLMKSQKNACPPPSLLLTLIKKHDGVKIKK